MDRAGLRLKRVRERLKLTFREVEEASHAIAARRGNEEFAIALSRLADIENKGTVPSIYRLYALCAIYRLDLNEVLDWYGVPADELGAEAARIGLAETHLIGFAAQRAISIPEGLDRELDLGKTTFLSHLLRRWGRLPASLLTALDLRNRRYGFIGMEDWSMYPILHPGALVAIDESRRRIAAAGWANEFERPIYFLEERGGYLFGWCTLTEGRLLVQPHPASHFQPRVFEYPAQVDVIGQVVGVAMQFESRRRRPARPLTEKGSNPAHSEGVESRNSGCL